MDAVWRSFRGCQTGLMYQRFEHLKRIVESFMHPADKTVIITGASSGIGAATAQAFAAAGANVVLAARDEARLAAVGRAMAGRTLVAPTDVSDRRAIQRLVAETVSAFGGIDIVINN